MSPLQGGPHSLVPAKDMLSLEEAGFGAYGWTGALRTVRPSKDFFESTTIRQDQGWNTVVGESFSDSALAGSGYAPAN